MLTQSHDLFSRAARVAALLLCTAGSLAAQPVLVSNGTVSLSLEDAVSLALERNLGLKVERLLLEESEWTLFGNYGIYDLTFTSQVGMLDETSPAASNLDGAEVQIFEQQDFNVGLEQLTAAGGTVDLGWDNFRGETNSEFSLLNPQYRIDFDLTYRQPLLRDLGRLATEWQILVARNNYEISTDTFERQVTATVSEAKQRYWDLVDAQLQLEVDEEALMLAEELHEQNQVKVDVGTLAPLELVQSESGVAQRREALIRAQAAVQNAEDALRRLLNLDDELWSVPIETTTEAETETVTLDVDADIAAALEYRPVLRTQRTTLETLQLDEEYYQNQRRPRLDLAVTYGYNGLGGDVTEAAGGPLVQGGYGDAWDQVTDRQFDGWTAGVNFSMPVQNRAAEARYAIASISRERGEVALADLEAQISAEVRNTARQVETAVALIESSSVSLRLAEENLRAEEKRFENGLSTSYQVLEIQEDLSQARSRYVFAVTGYRKSLVEYLRVTGQLLKESGVEVVGEE